jgi:raffinose/stachyose/melibiose transport system substrate-binding protein
VRKLRALGLVAVSIVVAACSSSSSTPTPAATSASGASTAASQAASSEPVVQSRKITWLLARPTDGPVVKVIQSLATEYGKTHPGFSLDLQTTPDRPSYLQKVETLAAANKLTDLWDTDATPYAQQLREKGLMVDAGAFLKSIGQYDTFRPSALDYVRFDDGSLYLIPWEFHLELFWYNKALFQKAGVSIPANLEDIPASCQAFRSQGIIPMAMDGQDGWPLLRQLAFIPFRLTGETYINNLKMAKASLNDDPGKRAVQYVYDLGKNNCLQDGWSAASYTDARDLFTTGKAAMYYMGTWELGTFTADTLSPDVKNNIDYFTLPMTSGATTKPNDFIVVSGIGMAMNKATFDPAVQDWVKYMLVNYPAQYAAQQQFPPMKAQINTTGTSALYQKVVAQMDNLGTTFGKPWDTQLDPTSNTRIQSELVLLAQNKETPDQFISTIDGVIKDNAPKYFGGS